MTFEQWCEYEGLEGIRIGGTDMVSTEVLRACWDFQAKEIERLEKELE